jgi:hypothetical protein
MKDIVKNSDIVMLLPDAPYLAMQMPDHVPGVPRTGKTSGYFKFPPGTMWHAFHYMTVSILGKPMSKEKMLERFEQFIKECPTFGSKGGTRADANAYRAFRCMYNEGLIVKLA